MDYEKLCQESLDSIMSAIRAENHKSFAKANPPQSSSELDKIKRDAELEYVDAAIAEASVGAQIGLRKAPMYRRRGLARKAARLLEAVYLRIAEFTNRDLRSFAAAMIASARIVRSKLERLFLNDQILEDSLKALKSDTETKLSKLQGQAESENKAVFLLSRKNEELSRTLEAQAAAIEKLRDVNERLASEIQAQTENRERENAELSCAIEKLRDVNERLFSDMQLQTEDRDREIHSKLTALSKRSDELSHALEAQSAALKQNEYHDAKLGNELSDLRDRVSQLAALREAQAALLGEAKKSIASDGDRIRYLTRRVGALELQSRTGGISASAAPASESTAGMQSKTEADMFYHDFEERFRGSYEDICSRLEVYKPILTELLGSFEGKRFVDLGCGRGEMLDFLCSNGGENCIGVDLNSIQLGICRDKGHETSQQDCLEYLRGLENESVDAVTAIQLVEHLPFEKLKMLFAECERVVKKGGVIVFETPNCKNIITASAYFYMDPSHIHPLPPELLEYMAESCGFGDIQIVYANANIYSNKLELSTADDEMSRIFNKNAAQLNELLYGPQDYALIGVKR